MSIHTEYETLVDNIDNAIYEDGEVNEMAEFQALAMTKPVIVDFISSGKFQWWDKKDNLINAVERLFDKAELSMDQDGQYLNDIPNEIENFFAEMNLAIDEYFESKGDEKYDIIL